MPTSFADDEKEKGQTQRSRIFCASPECKETSARASRSRCQFNHKKKTHFGVVVLVVSIFFLCSSQLPSPHFPSLRSSNNIKVEHTQLGITPKHSWFFMLKNILGAIDLVLWCLPSFFWWKFIGKVDQAKEYIDTHTHTQSKQICLRQDMKCLCRLI